MFDHVGRGLPGQSFYERMAWTKRVPFTTWFRRLIRRT